MDDDRGVRLEANAKAHRAMSKAAGISWPLPADRRLDQLVRLANDAGAATHRNELTAAMVAATAEAWGATAVMFDEIGHDVMLDVGWERVADGLADWVLESTGP